MGRADHTPACASPPLPGGPVGSVPSDSPGIPRPRRSSRVPHAGRVLAGRLPRPRGCRAAISALRWAAPLRGVARKLRRLLLRSAALPCRRSTASPYGVPPCCVLCGPLPTPPGRSRLPLHLAAACADVVAPCSRRAAALPSATVVGPPAGIRSAASAACCFSTAMADAVRVVSAAHDPVEPAVHRVVTKRSEPAWQDRIGNRDQHHSRRPGVPIDKARRHPY